MRSHRALGVGLLWALAGCAQSGGEASDPGPIPVRVLAAPGQCGAVRGPAVYWIAHEREWGEWHRRINNQWLNPPPPPAVDFSTAGVILIAMGQQATVGYSLSLADDTADVRDGVLTVRVDWREPAFDSRQAQMLTNPCLLLKLPDAAFTRIEVLDPAGRVWLEGRR
ncbi:MAG: protease complex subunit PrcB family protein [Candidatus Contendobacter sp.]